MTNPYLNPDAGSSRAPHPQQRQEPPTWKKVLAFISIAAGSMMIFAGLVSGYFFFGLFLAAAFGLPGVWWFVHERREKKGAEPLKRHWGFVAVASIVCFFLSAPFADDQESTDKQASTTTASSSSVEASTPAETADSSTTVETTSTETTSEELTEESSSEEVTTSGSNPAPFVAPLNNDDDDDHYIPAPKTPRTHVPDPPAYHEPAPAPAPNKSFSSCKQAKAAGAAPLYRGSPGYSSSLDRDGDGVACEK